MQLIGQQLFSKLIVTIILISSWFMSFSQNKKVFCDSLNQYENTTFIGVVDTSVATTYPFIHFDRNYYHFFTKESPNFQQLYYQLDQMIRYHDRKLNFYHIGGSHLQADVYSNVMRERLQTQWEGLPGERGWVFPFNLAGTNNPANYRFTSPNHWTGYRSVINRHTAYGVLGMAISTTEDSIQISFDYKNTNSQPPIDVIRIYHNKGAFPYKIRLLNDTTTSIRSQKTDETIGCTDVTLSNEIQSFTLSFDAQRDSSLSTDSTFISPQKHEPFFLYGFELLNNRPGISYTAIGVNGAGLYTYLDNRYFKEQLEQYPPDFFAFSVGTNDANTTYAGFNPSVYKHNLEKMMNWVLEANPNCAILLTVPNDALYRRRYLNKNVARERKVIIELAEKYQLPVWDLYGIMGELGASRTWVRNQLMRSDHVHFTHSGYILKGKLFYASFLKWKEQMELSQYEYLKRIQ